jgi:hypothetical protein
MRARAGAALILAASVAPTLAAGSRRATSKFPTFTRPTVKTFKSTAAVAVGDLNGDGKMDVAEASIGGASQGSPGAVSVLLNKGGAVVVSSRRATTSPTRPTTSWSATSMAVAGPISP